MSLLSTKEKTIFLIFILTIASVLLVFVFAKKSSVRYSQKYTDAYGNTLEVYTSEEIIKNKIQMEKCDLKCNKAPE